MEFEKKIMNIRKMFVDKVKYLSNKYKFFNKIKMSVKTKYYYVELKVRDLESKKNKYITYCSSTNSYLLGNYSYIKVIENFYKNKFNKRKLATEFYKSYKDSRNSRNKDLFELLQLYKCFCDLFLVPFLRKESGVAC